MSLWDQLLERFVPAVEADVSRLDQLDGLDGVRPWTNGAQRQPAPTHVPDALPWRDEQHRPGHRPGH